ncbi:transcriptional activator/repressor MOT3-like [Daphnia pulicaria]|uniref:transcriptional activator/repressor MOT3-like n=1 Tax=Daphnia pulicaria TaxID=35523 RepID=UPI001EEA148C|nr:transcriptional activator/repressor MOT3-like [Daphnia pulicaria]
MKTFYVLFVISVAIYTVLAVPLPQRQGNDPFGSSSRDIDDMFAANPAYQRAQHQREQNQREQHQREHHQRERAKGADRTADSSRRGQPGQQSTTVRKTGPGWEHTSTSSSNSRSGPGWQRTSSSTSDKRSSSSSSSSNSNSSPKKNNQQRQRRPTNRPANRTTKQPKNRNNRNGNGN